ncbi:MAG: hypothetical protein UX94_C0005G0061 [Parcubacteria group bacterium GW2011_GWA2_47_21]|nr:MAG: hypothetical protein UX94_C0005G0061 [Parcubacteria group bacterium GW2011_GWA2_47_21]
MNEEEKELLEETHRLAAENNEIIKKFYRSHKWGRAIKITYWVLILGTAFGAYWLIQPYLEAITGSIGTVRQSVESVRNVGDSLKQLAE